MKKTKNILSLALLSSCLFTVMGCDKQTDKSKEVDQENVVFKKDNIVLNNFEGLGVEWGTYEDPDKLSSSHLRI